jgi:hypothetical protein
MIIVMAYGYARRAGQASPDLTGKPFGSPEMLKAMQDMAAECAAGRFRQALVSMRSVALRSCAILFPNLSPHVLQAVVSSGLKPRGRDAHLCALPEVWITNPKDIPCQDISCALP